MRVVWLLLCLSLASAEDQSSCGVLPTENSSDCSLTPSHSRVTRELDEYASKKEKVKHKRHLKKLLRAVRSAQEDFERDASPQQNCGPIPLYTNYEDQTAVQGPADWGNLMRQIQSSHFLQSARYCPHCRQLLPPESAILPHPTDPRMFLPAQAPRVQAIPIVNPPAAFSPQEEFSLYNMNNPPPIPPEEMCPINYRVVEEVPQADFQPYFNESVLNPNKIKDYKKTPAGLSDRDSAAAPEESSTSSPTVSRAEMASFYKQCKLPTVEELTKYLESKKNS